MGKPTYKFGKNAKEKAKQQKQMEKASKRLIAKQRKTNINSSTPNEDSDIVESSRMVDIAKGTV
jgi:hypothetical protein